ncbi:MAG TPA: OmpA family protein [Saprospiraceae bacterium]|nr:OmpA family protein [Saprospiraceae bacterium]
MKYKLKGIVKFKNLAITGFYFLLFTWFIAGDLLGQKSFPFLEPGKTHIIKSIYFGGGRYYIDEEQKQEMLDFFETIILENYEIHIHSYTDDIGGAEYNQWLSRMRSRATLQMLMDAGIPVEHLFVKDHGMFNPKFDNNTWDGRLKNRRVDIVLWPLSA